jgi:hypothetical protein
MNLPKRTTNNRKGVMPLVAVMVNLAGISKGAEGAGTFAPSALPLANKVT